MTSNIEEFLGAAQAPRLSVPINRRADLLARHAQLKEAHARALRDDLGNAGITGGKLAPEIQRQIEECEDEMADSVVTFTFEGLGRQEYERLRAAAPPRREDKAQQLDFNADTFPPMLFAACCVEPAMTLEQAQRLCAQVTEGQFTDLWQAAIAVNVGSDAVPKSVRRSATGEPSGTSSTTAALGESPDLFSSGG